MDVFLTSAANINHKIYMEQQENVPWKRALFPKNNNNASFLSNLEFLHKKYLNMCFTLVVCGPYKPLFKLL